MKTIYRKFLVAIALLVGIESTPALAQVPNCTGPSLIYILEGQTNSIYNYDPSQPPSATNPSLNTIPAFQGAAGITVNTNINGGTPATTFYIVDFSGFYHYYNGTAWVNTGHFSGSALAVNIAGGGAYIYNLAGSAGQVYRYDGTGTGTLLVTIPNYVGPFDLVADCNGDFYALNTNASVMQLQKYSSAGALLQTYAIIGLPAGTGAGGFSIDGNLIYVDDGTNQIYQGTIGAANVTFTAPVQLSSTFSFSDFASCFAGSSGVVLLPEDTIYQCPGAPPVSVTANGAGPFTWSVVSGPATVTPNTGSTITASATATSRIRVASADPNICGSSVDTLTLIVPNVAVNAGADYTIVGCGTYPDTLAATAIANSAMLNLTYAWTPAADIAAGANTLTPTINPTGLTSYVLTVSTAANQGACAFTDTINVNIQDASLTPGYTFTIKFGCAADTVVFTNTSTNATGYIWNFADGTTDTATNPIKIYPTQNTYNVSLTAINKYCRDSVVQNIDTQHPLEALFDVSDDTLCQGATVTFTNNSNFTNLQGPTTFLWQFGDGQTDTVFAPTHTYTRAGVFEATLIATDWLPCRDTFRRLIVVDTLPFLSFVTSDTALCEGQDVGFYPNFLAIGNTGLQWSFGDGITSSVADTIVHAYDTAGLYTVTLTGAYRVCPSLTFTKNVFIKPFPTIDLGPDTTICLNGQPVFVQDRTNFNNPLATWRWNTGDTAASFIIARHPGLYSATVTLAGCSAADSVTLFKDCYADIPNAFSPNNDGINDYFLPRQLLTKSVASFKLVIYNRWGQEIFQTTSLEGRGWDGRFNGREQPEGVYVYQFEALLLNGASEKQQGNVTLLR